MKALDNPFIKSNNKLISHATVLQDLGPEITLLDRQGEPGPHLEGAIRERKRAEGEQIDHVGKEETVLAPRAKRGVLRRSLLL